MSNKKILLGLTTTKKSNWREKIKEIQKYEIKDIALFLTGIPFEERKELYKLLENTNIDFIYHAHLRNDMTVDEVSYLSSRYNVQAFNIHSLRSTYASEKELIKHFKSKIYIENTSVVPKEEELKGCAGFCVDFSHWEVQRFTHWYEYRNMKKLLEKYKIGCSHISAVKRKLKIFSYDNHNAKDYKNFNYLSKYKKYLPEFMSLELENSFAEQMKIKNYIEKNILNS